MIPFNFIGRNYVAKAAHNSIPMFLRKFRISREKQGHADITSSASAG